MLIQLDFWFKGVPKDRPGGPWWRETFVNEVSAFDFLRTIQPFLEKFYLARFNTNNCCWEILESKDGEV